MKLHIHRDTKFDDTTLGTMTVGGEHFCETLEDADRELEIYPERKVYGATAIPRGTYKVGITFSNRFQKDMLQLFDVPGFSGVRIHAGNTHLDTDGCPLVGGTRVGRTVRGSRLVAKRLFNLVNDALIRGEEVTCEIS